MNLIQKSSRDAGGRRVGGGGVQAGASGGPRASQFKSNSTNANGKWLFIPNGTMSNVGLSYEPTAYIIATEDLSQKMKVYPK